MWIQTRRLGQFGECRTLAPAENIADATGFNPIAKQLARAFAQDACSAFTPSHHANAHKRTSGANIHCVRCHKPQYQHWLRQALENSTSEAVNG